MNVTRIWTRGRHHSSEYVMEYSISYGSNGYDYADYKDPGGNIKVRTKWTLGCGLFNQKFLIYNRPYIHFIVSHPYPIYFILHVIISLKKSFFFTILCLYVLYVLISLFCVVVGRNNGVGAD